MRRGGEGIPPRKSSSIATPRTEHLSRNTKRNELEDPEHEPSASGVIDLGVNQKEVWKTQEEEDHCFEGVHGVAIIATSTSQRETLGQRLQENQRKDV